MAEEVANSSRIRVVSRVVEPGAALKGELEAALSRQVPLAIEGAAELDVDEVHVGVVGPGAPLEAIASLRPDCEVVLALGSCEQVDRVEDALSRGADDAFVWSGPRELILRVDASVGRWLTAHALEVERRDLRALLDLSEALGTTHDIEGTLFHIARRMADVIRSERCSIIVLDDDANYGFVVATSDDKSIRNHPIPVAARYPEILEVVRTGAPLVIGDVESDPIFDGVREMIRDKPVRNTALFPVPVNGRVQGVLHLRGGDIRPGGLSPRQLRFGTIVANATGIAVRNARVYQTIRDRAERVLSARLKAERRLRQLQKYQRFFDLAGDGLIIVDHLGRILFSNQAAVAIFGFQSNDLSQIRLMDLVEPEGRSTLDELFAGFREGRHRRRIDLPVLRASGQSAMLSLSTAPLDSASGDQPVTHDESFRDVAAIISIRDVTETRAIEVELRKTKEFLENLIESSVDAIVAADMRGRIVIFNGGAERITGYTREETIGKLNVAALYPPGTAQEIMRRLRSPEGGGVGRYSSTRQDLLTRDGTTVPISLSAALIYDHGKEIASVGVFSDLRERLRMEEELAFAQRKLQVTERQAAILELAGAAAHELSQPLTTILGSAELMQRKVPKGSPGSEQVPRILDECERMASIVRKIGQITKYETKQYVGYTNIVDLDAASTSGEKR